MLANETHVEFYWLIKQATKTGNLHGARVLHNHNTPNTSELETKELEYYILTPCLTLSNTMTKVGRVEG